MLKAFKFHFAVLCISQKIVLFRAFCLVMKCSDVKPLIIASNHSSSQKVSLLYLTSLNSAELSFESCSGWDKNIFRLFFLSSWPGCVLAPGGSHGALSGAGLGLDIGRWGENTNWGRAGCWGLYCVIAMLLWPP